ncbi:shikimate kinase [Enterococcus cecorum]
MKTTIVLVGYMGAGKSTVAKLLAEKLAMPIVDLDKKIEESAQLSIPDIFAKQGEAVLSKIRITSFTSVFTTNRNYRDRWRRCTL